MKRSKEGKEKGKPEGMDEVESMEEVKGRKGKGGMSIKK